MKNFSLSIAALLLAVTGTAFSQNSNSGVTVSQDPAKAAAVERHAADIKARPQATAAEAPATRSVRHHGKKHHAKRHAKKHHAKKHHAKKHHVKAAAAK